MKDSTPAVKCVAPGSIAADAGIEPGDILLSVNGELVGDVFDYRFNTSNENLVIEVLKKDGQVWELEIEKDEYEDLGIEFENSMLDEAKSCSNKCVFCFIDQLPRGMRETLYFKDDDSRLSFLTGSYVTLTNMKAQDIERIVRYRMSPINVSVHTTNPELRKLMLGNRFAGDVMEKLRILADGRIAINCQIVLCRGLNDGEELDRTISDLSGLHPAVNSISVVPVGLTRHREGLYRLIPFDREASLEVIGQVEEWQAKLLDKYGSRMVYPADEFFVLGESELPDHEAYEDFPQLENGVGLLSLFRQEFFEALKELKTGRRAAGGRHVSIATGVSSFKFISGLAKELENKLGSLKVDIYEIKNEFFGKNVTVTGLLTGRDIAGQLTGKALGNELLLSESMLRANDTVFLDDMSVRDLEEKLGVRITMVENSGGDFIDKILGKR